MGALEIVIATLAVVLVVGFLFLDTLVDLTDWSEERRLRGIRRRRAEILAGKARGAEPSRPGGPG